jgi:hypothetical protein
MSFNLFRTVAMISFLFVLIVVTAVIPTSRTRELERRVADQEEQLAELTGATQR